MKKHTIKFVAAAVLSIGSAGFAVIGARADEGATQYPHPAWMADDGAILIDKLPPALKLATDKYGEGYALLDSQAFKTRSLDGPYDVFAPEDTALTKVAYWYYHGIGIVPIGTSIEDAQRSNPSPATTAVERADAPNPNETGNTAVPGPASTVGG